MRYEDTSGSISSSATPEARGDADTLPNGSNGPATGNVITGAGTTTGKAGADTPASGHVVEVRGASGSDTTSDGGSMHVDGRFGTLAIDDHGNYKYVADGHAPQNFRDIFQYTLANAKGDRSMADLVISRGGEIKVADNAQRMVPGPDGVVTLPAGVNLNDVHVVGRDLVVDMPDGSQIVIVDGAVFVPQLVLGGVEVPATNLAALMIDTESFRTTAGTPQSSGGNFDVPVPPLDPGVPLGDLIPPTELVFGQPIFEEIGQFINHEPTIEIQPEDQTPSVAAQDSVNERGLPTRNGGEPAGSGEIADGNGANNSDTSETTTGTIIIDSQDTPNSVSINGVAVTGVAGQTIVGAFGTLTITGFSGQNILYSYTLHDNTSGDTTHDDFSVTVTDHDGDQATATLRIDIIDDVPTARPDTDAVAAGTYGPETGNVLTGVGTTSGTAGADTVGADNAHISGVTGFNGSNDSSAPFVVNGQYGVLTLQTDGSYSYTRNPGTPGGVNDVFNYTLTDGDGDTSTTTLTISIGDSTPHTGENPLIRFDDDALPGGNPGGVGDDSPATVNASGTLAGSGGDGPLTFAVQTTGASAGFSYVSGGAGIVLIQQNGHTVLTVTVGANGSYSVVQNAPIDHSAGGDENNQVFTINYTVTDQDNDSAPGTFSINVDDDTPTVSLVGEGEPQLIVDETDLTINASASFAGKFAVSFGADGPAAANSLSYTLGINAGATGLIDVATGQPIVLVLNGGVVEGHVGDASGALAFTVSVDASGTVTLDQLRALQHPNPANPDDSVTLANDNLVTLTATATDHDADTASQTLNIGTNLHFEDDGPTISLSGSEPSLTVDETVLGTDASASFAGAFTSAFGADGAGTVTYALSILSSGANSGLVDTATGQPIVLVLNGGVVEGHVGNAAGLLAFTVSVDANGNVTLDQIRAVVHPNTANPDDSVTLSADNLVSLTATVSDKDGDSQSATLDIGQNLNFEDDGPSITLSGTEPSLTVDETNLAINAGPTNFAPAFAPVFGADGAAAANSLTYALGITGGNGTNSGLVDTATDEAVILVNNGGVIEGRTANSNLLVFTVTVNATGQVTLDQLRAVVHPNTANPDDSITLAADNLITLTATATDGDGDQASATLNIGQNLNFEDDGPSANNDTDTTDPVTDTAVGNVITGVGTTEGAANADQPGNDGFGAITNLTGFNGSSDSDATGGFTVNGQFGTLQMDANGNYTYTRNGGPGGAVETFTYTYVDGDGDPATATLTITIADERPVAGTVNVGLDDDALANGNPGGIGDDPDSVNATGNLPGSGGDAPLTFGVLLTGAPAGFSYVSGGAGIVLVQQNGVTVLTVTVNSTTGAYSVVQNAPIDHSAGGDENNQNFTITYTVTDFDSDVANGTINISVDDDTPTVSANAAVQLDDDALAGGNPGGIGDDANATNTSGTLAHSYGADGAGSVAYLTTGAPAGFSYVLQPSGDLWVMQGATHVLTLTVNSSTGAYTVSQVAPIVHAAGGDENNQSFTISYRVTDGDGDTVDGSINVNVDDDTPTVSANAAVQLDDDALAGGNPGGTGDVNPDTANTSGTLAHSYGADGAGSVALLGSGAPAGFTYDTSTPGTLLIKQGATTVITVTVNATTGAYTVTQNAPIAHPAGSDENDVAFTVNYRVSDSDGDTVDGSIVINVDDDTPTATIVATGANVSVDESVGVQVDSNDTTSASVIALFSGVAAPVGTDTDLPQYATNANAIVASTGSSYGADGAGTTSYSLNVSSAGVDSGLNTTDGHDILLYKEGNLIVGRVSGGADDGKAAFAIAIDNTGHISTVEYLSIQHPDGTNPDDSVSIANGAVTATVTLTDSDGDSTSSTPLAIGSHIQFQDSGPVMTAAQNMNIQNSGDVAHTASFAFNLGADGANIATNDVITNVTGSATVGGVAVTNWTLTPGTEDATTASYSFSFDYPIGGGNTAHETGTLVFNKVAGTYTIDLDNPIQGVTTILQTAQGTLFQGYEFGTSTPDGSQPVISVTQIQDLAGTANDIYVQFTSVAEPSSGTGDNNLEVTNWVPGADNPPPVNGGGDVAWNAGQLFNQTDSWVSTSNSANGVAGDTIQGGEVLDFSLVQGANPTGTLAAPSTYAQASAMFLKFDGIGSAEDMIVILKLYDPNTNTYTTRAIMVENSDIQKGPGTGPGQYSGITLDQNDGLVIIEANDYNLPGENWVIVGAQIAGSDEGITGTAIDLNSAIGAAGDSVTGNAFDTDPLGFQSDTNDGPFKISSIGFLTTQTTPQNAQLDFNVTVTDGDGDSITQAISATVTAAADSSTPISLSSGVTTVAAAPLNPKTTAASDAYPTTQQSPEQTTTNSNNVLMGAFAAAGLAASHSVAAESLHGDLNASVSPLATAAYHTQDLAPIALDSVSGSHGFEVAPALNFARGLATGDAAASHAAPEQVAAQGGLAGAGAEAAQQPAFAAFLQGTQAPAHDGGALSSMAAAVGMPSAQQLAALAGGGVSGAQHNQVVSQVLADALHGGGGAPVIDQALASLPGHGSGMALDVLASHNAAGVPFGDSSAFAGFSAAHSAISMEAMMVHVDAVQPHA